MEGKVNPHRKFVRAPNGDGITWVGPKASEAPARSAAPAKRGLAKPLVGLAAILMLQGVILLAFRAKEDERTSLQTVAATTAEAAEAPPAWSTPLSTLVFPGLEEMRRKGEAHVLRKPGARESACRQGACE